LRSLERCVVDKMVGGNIIMISSMEEFKKHTGGSALVVVDFTASWCGPCQRIAPIFAALSEEFGDVVFLKVDVDENADIAEMAGVQAMPTFMWYKNGNKIEEMVGADPNQLKANIQKLQ